MNPRILWSLLRKNLNLILVLVSVACPVIAVGRAVRGVSWSLLMPVALLAVLCGWWAGRSRLNGRQVAGWMVALGFPGVFIYVVNLATPIRNFVFSGYSVAFQAIRWLADRSPINFEPLRVSWEELSGRVVVASLRLGEWLIALVSGKPAVDSAPCVFQIRFYLCCSIINYKEP